MAKDMDRELQRLQNHLDSDEYRQDVSAKVRNTDKTDVNLKKYSASVEKPAKKGCGCTLFILLLLALAAAWLLMGGDLPWNG